MKRATIRKGRLVASEEAEQIAVIEWARANEHRWWELMFLFHIPNGGSRNKAEAAKLKRMGVKPGVPDLFLPAPRAIYTGLFIEMKRVGGDLENEQGPFLRCMSYQGYCARVCEGAGEAIAVLESYLTLPGQKNPPC